MAINKRFASEDFVNDAMSQVPQADWNQNDETAKDYIKNKPFGETTVMGDTLYWDGNTEGLTIVNDNIPIMGYLVSNVAPTFEQLKNGVTIVKKNFNGDEIERLEFSYEEIMEEYAPESDQIILGQVFIQMNDLYYTASDLVDGEWVPSEKVSPKGMWLHVDYEFETYIAEVQIHGAKLFERTEIKKIPAEYLPDGVPYEEERVITILKDHTVEAHENGSHTEDITVDEIFKTGDKVIVSVYGKDYECIAEDDDGEYMVRDYYNEEPDFALGSGVDENGKWVHIELRKGEGDITIRVVKKEIHKIPEKYLPSIPIDILDLLFDLGFNEIEVANKLQSGMTYENYNATIPYNGNFERVYERIYPCNNMFAHFVDSLGFMYAYDDGDGKYINASTKEVFPNNGKLQYNAYYFNIYVENTNEIRLEAERYCNFSQLVNI